jgi:hypothetical protein
MNERIQELYRQAHEPQPPTRGTGTLTKDILWEQPNKFNPEKFAELIVRECITVIENKMPDFTCKEDYENLIRKAGRMDAIDEIEQHFGVEQ